ncbi:MAG: AbrB/MazE/SpoVT family DNA-binding domain-containing protein [Nitrospirae bacterium]|nr:AbrB/MazE/SpoVT family DNA-binding domain-containing protein [Nitrospirota bacterium]MBI3352879.1 AbrB/MazE/SpoVT family DNA-binding domain-containing protein [Nitrospirota bacterium]
MKARVDDRGQVTIPKELRKKLGIKPGTVLDFNEQNGKLVAIKMVSVDPVEKVYGCLKTKVSTDAWIERLKGLN